MIKNEAIYELSSEQMINFQYSVNDPVELYQKTCSI